MVTQFVTEPDLEVLCDVSPSLDTVVVADFVSEVVVVVVCSFSFFDFRGFFAGFVSFGSVFAFRFFGFSSRKFDCNFTIKELRFIV